jgi:predicted nucleic acid-binding Zn ribbon protein
VRRSGPRPLGAVLPAVSLKVAPATTLARVQQHWAGAVGDAIAREAKPVAEREGTVTVACRSAVWAAELQLLAPDLVGRLNDALEPSGAGRPVSGLRVTAAARPDVT